MPAADEELRAAYLLTTWSVRTPGGTLRLAPGGPAPRPLRPSAIVTAYNPASRPATRAENRAAARRLRAEASALGLRWLPARAHGTGPRRHLWHEPGLALLGPAARAAAVRLGERYSQNAILAVHADGRVALVATRPGFCGHAAGEEVR